MATGTAQTGSSLGDMPALAELSIAGFVGAILLFYNGVRASVKTIHDEIQDTKTYERDLSSLERKLNTQRKSLEEWKLKWHVHEHIPRNMFVRIWGDEFDYIFDTLSNFKNDCEAARRAWRAIRPREAPQEQTNDQRVQELSEPRQAERNASEARRPNKLKTWYLKRKFIWVKRSHMENLLRDL